MRPAMRESHSRLSEAERITPIWCQVSGMAWQKAWTAPSVFGEKRALETKSTPEVPIETKAVPGVTTPTPQAAAALSPAPPATTTAPPTPQRAARSGRRSPEGGAALDEARHVGAGEAGRLEQVVGPVAGGDVEPEGAGGVGHLRDVVAGQAEADVVLGQQHGVDAGEDLGLVLAEPGDLRGGEAGHGDVAGDLARAREGGFDLGAFGHGAAVVPEDRRAEHAGRRGRGRRRRASGRRGRCRAGRRARGRGRSRRWSSRRACHQASGSCSDQPGWGRWTVSGWLAWPIRRWSRSKRTVLTEEVPMSMPRYMASLRSAVPVHAWTRSQAIDIK